MTQEEQPPQQIGIQTNNGGDINIEQSHVHIVGRDLHIHYPQLAQEPHRRPPSDESFGWEVASHVEKLLQEYTTKPFVGREGALTQLNTFLTKNLSGRLTITARAGFGKTALLAHWLTAGSLGDYFVAYHFFSSRNSETTKVVNALRNLLRQIYIYYELTDAPLPHDGDSLRDTLHKIIQDRGVRSDRPLIIVLDGLDEAQETFSPPFPDPLPDGMFVVASARAEEGEKPEYLSDWTDGTTYLRLTRLPRTAIADYLRSAGHAVLMAFAEDEDFIAQMDERTEGFPLYLQYLTEELIQTIKAGQDVREALLQTPRGFKEYVNQQIKHLDKLSLELKHPGPERIWTFFALLAVAKGALRQEEIKAKALMGMHKGELRRLALIWQVARWLLIREIEEEGTTLYTFAHPLLAKTFAEALDDEAQEAREQLLTFCKDWQKHRSRYALEHYVDHLQELQRYEEVFTIARDEAFWQAQAEVFPDDLDLPLRTIRTALAVASQIDNAKAMAEFSLMHIQRLRESRQEMPLTALRAGNVQRAWELADLFEGERRVLWYLLLAWELKEEGKWEEAKLTLERLLRRDLPQLSYWQAEFAAQMLAYTLDVNRSAFTHLYRRLLKGEGREMLCKYLADLRHFDVALDVAQGMCGALAIVAIAQVNAGQQADARSTALSAYQAAQQVTREFPLARDSVFKDAIEALAYAGELDIASAAVQEIRPHAWVALSKARIQAAIVYSYIREGEFASACKLAEETISLPSVRAETLVDIALAQAKAGESTAALKTLVRALDIGPELDGSEWYRVLARAAEVEAWAGEFEAALDIANEFASERLRLEVLVPIAVAQVQLRESEEAQATFACCLEIAQSFSLIAMPPPPTDAIAARNTVAIAYEHIGENAVARSLLAEVIANVPPEEEGAFEEQAEKMAAIGVAQALAGEFVAALETAKQIKVGSKREEVLSAIAVSQAREGDFAAAMSTVEEMEKDSWEWVRTPQKIVEVQARAGKFAAAITTAKSIRGGQPQVEALTAVALAQAKAGEQIAAHTTLQMALETALASGDGWQRAHMLAPVAVAQVRVGERMAARGTFAAVREAIHTIEDTTLRARAMANVLATAQVKAGERMAAQATFAAALATIQIQQIKDESDAWFGLLDIIETQALGGVQEATRSMLAVAFELSQHMWEREQRSGEERHLSPRLYDLARRQAQIGELTAAFRTIAGRGNVESRQQHLLEVFALAQAKRGEGEQAVRAAMALLTERSTRLPRIAEALLESADFPSFKRMLVPCAYYRGAVYRMCRLLVQAYPGQAAAVAAVMSESDRMEQLRKQQQYEPKELRLEDLLPMMRKAPSQQSQAETFAIDPNLSLSIARTALLEAIETDDARAMASFLLLHAQHVVEITNQSPLDVLRANGLLQAREVIDLLDAEHSVLWHLLLVWELKDAGRLEEAQTTLERILTKELPHLKDWKSLCAVALLAYAAEVNGENAITLQSQLLDDDARSILCRLLTVQGHSAIAREVARSIKHAGKRVIALIIIAHLQQQAGAKEEIQATLALALDTVRENTWKKDENVMVSSSFLGPLPGKIPPIERLTVLLASIAATQAMIGEFTTAFETAQSITDQSLRDEALMNLAAAQAQAGEFDAALQTMKNIENEVLYDEALTNFVVAQAQSGEFSDAEERLQEIEGDAGKTQAQVALAEAYAQKGKFITALEIAQKIEQEWGQVDALCAIAQVQAVTGAFSDALTTARKIPKDIQGRETARSEILTLIVLAETDAGEMDNTVQIIQEVEQRDIQVTVYTMLAMKQAQKGHQEAALAVLVTALSAVQEVEDRVQRAILLARIAEVYVHCGNRAESQVVFASALEMARGVEQKQVTSSTNWQRKEALWSIAEIQVEAGEFVSAFEILQEIGINELASSIGLASYLGRDPLMSFAQLPEFANQEEERFKALVILLTTMGQVALALEIARRIGEEEKRAWTLLVIAETQAAIGETTAARDTMAIALEKAKNFDGEELSARALSTIVRAQAQTENLSAAMETVRGIADSEWRSAAQVGIAEVLAQKGEFAAAMRAVHDVEQKEAKDEVLVAIVKALAQAGNFRTALRRALEIRSPAKREEALTALVIEQADVGEFAAAFETVQRIEPIHQIAALTAIAVAQIYRGETLAAQKTVEKLGGGWMWINQEVSLLATIAAAQSQIGQAEAAHESFTSALERALEIEDKRSRSATLAVVAEAQAGAGLQEEALATFTTALETAKPITDESERAKALAAIAASQARVGLADEAMKTADMILRDRNEHLLTIANVFISADDYANFKRLFVPCAYYLDAAYRMCGLLAWAYPEQATAIAGIINGGDQKTSTT